MLEKLICSLLSLLSGSTQVNTAYNSQLTTPSNLSPNPITIPSVSNPSSSGSPYIQLLPLNKKRKQWILYNTGITTVVLKYSTPPNANSGDWTHILQASGLLQDGSGGLIIDEMWKGAIYAQSTTGAGQVILTELV